MSVDALITATIQPVETWRPFHAWNCMSLYTFSMHSGCKTGWAAYNELAALLYLLFVTSDDELTQALMVK